MASKIDIFCMKTAIAVSELSHATRMKVGAVIAKDGRIISTGYNGTPSGFDNECEDILENGETKTKDSVIHAESNAIFFCAKNGISSEGTTLYLTLSPCHICALAIIQAGIKKVYYLNAYRDLTGVEFLKKSGIDIEQIELD